MLVFGGNNNWSMNEWRNEWLNGQNASTYFNMILHDNFLECRQQTCFFSFHVRPTVISGRECSQWSMDFGRTKSPGAIAASFVWALAMWWCWQTMKETQCLVCIFNLRRLSTLEGGCDARSISGGRLWLCVLGPYMRSQRKTRPQALKIPLIQV